MKTNSITTTKLYIELDVHKEKTSIALAEPGTDGEIRHYGEVATRVFSLQCALNNRWLEEQGVPDMRAFWIVLHYGPHARV